MSELFWCKMPVKTNTASFHLALGTPVNARSGKGYVYGIYKPFQNRTSTVLS